MKPYKLAELCYDVDNPETPWYVVRTGAVAEQGGIGFGQEGASFYHLVDACDYIASATRRDLDVIMEKIKLKEGNK